MSRIKLLLNLIDDVRAVADDLQMIAEAMANDNNTPDVEQEPISEAATTDSKQEKAIRLEDVRAVLAAKSRDGYGDRVRELIAKHGGSRLSDIDPSEYAAMLKEAEVFGNAT